MNIERLKRSNGLCVDHETYLEMPTTAMSTHLSKAAASVEWQCVGYNACVTPFRILLHVTKMNKLCVSLTEQIDVAPWIPRPDRIDDRLGWHGHRADEEETVRSKAEPI